jgi:hypothetical protein
MMNAIETQPGALVAPAADGATEANVAAEASAAAVRGARTAEGSRGDVVAANPALSGFAYGALVAARRDTPAAFEGDSEPEAARDGGFSEKVTAYANLPGGQTQTDEGDAAPSARDAEAFAQAGLLGESQSLQSMPASRLARSAARNGAALVAKALNVALAPLAPASAGTTPQALPANARSARRDDERSRQRRETEPSAERDARDEATLSPPSQELHSYTIDDIVQFGGETVAIQRFDTRSLPWPS